MSNITSVKYANFSIIIIVTEGTVFVVVRGVCDSVGDIFGNASTRYLTNVHASLRFCVLAQPHFFLSFGVRASHSSEYYINPT